MIECISFFLCVFSFFRFRNKVSHSGKYLSPRTQYGTSMLYTVQDGLGLQGLGYLLSIGVAWGAKRWL